MKIIRTVLSIVAVTFLVYRTEALPRFATMMNFKCADCHIDPNGGGMRNYYGAVMFARETLPTHFWEQDSTFANFTPKLNDFISFGTDMQTIFYYLTNGHNSSFYQMIGDIYLSARLSKNVLLYFNKRLSNPIDQFSDFDVFGIANVLPANGYVKVGRFTPAYGTRIDDHTTYIRTKTVFPYFHRDDTGIELGISPQSLAWNVGVYNGENGQDPSNGYVRLVTSRAEMNLRTGSLNYSFGGSVWYNNGIAGNLLMYDGFAGIAFDKFTVNGEIDIKRDTAVISTNQFISYLEINYLLIDGVDLKFIYDYYRPDVRSSDAVETRYSFGIEFFPVTGVELRPIYRIGGTALTGGKSNEFDLLMHLFL